MRANPTKHIEDFRITVGPLRSEAAFGANGAFQIPGPQKRMLNVVASDGSDWQASGLPLPVYEHVSVSIGSSYRTPSWEEMDFVKRIFWRDDETVIQLHVPRSQHVNFHPGCLHLWRPVGVEIALPPTVTVGPLKTNHSPGIDNISPVEGVTVPSFGRGM